MIKRFWNQIVVMVAQVCEYTKSWIVHFLKEWIEWYINISIFKSLWQFGLLYLKENNFLNFLKRFYLLLERGEGREAEGERPITVWFFSRTPHWRPGPKTQACALTGNQIGNRMVHRPVLNPLSHTSQVSKKLFFNRNLTL